MTPLVKYAIAAGAVIAVSGAVWFHGYSHGVDVERGRTVAAIEKARAQDAREIERLRDIVSQRRKVVTKTVEVIRNAQAECLDTRLPGPIIDGLRDTYNASIRSAAD